MSGPEVSLDELLDRLEGAIARLADGRAPLEELVASHGEAVRLVGEAQARLDALSERAQRLGARHR